MYPPPLIPTLKFPHPHLAMIFYHPLSHFKPLLSHLKLLCLPENIHSMCTKAKSGIVKPRLNPTFPLTHAEPKSVKSAISNPTWYEAMKSEYDALIKLCTWTLVELPSHKMAIGCKY